MNDTQLELFKSALVRALRAAIWTGASVTLYAHPNFADPGITLKVLGASFLAGFGMGLFKYIRDNFGSTDGSGLINKLPF